jgi:hypothetical protein
VVEKIDTETPHSPGWWLQVMLRQLHDRRVGRRGREIWSRDQVKSSKLRPGLDLLNDYRRGDPPLREDIHSGWAAPFRQFVRMGRLNIADLDVSATGNRMGIRGFRTAAADDELGDVAARAIMKRNNLSLLSRDVHDYMLGLGDGYTLLTPPDEERDYTLITAESPLQCITAHDPATGETLAGLKVFRDDEDESDWAYLFLPGRQMGGLYVARSTGPTEFRRRGQFRFVSTWEWVEYLWDDVPGNVVPIVRFRNKGGIGEFENHLDHLDRINNKIFNEWWISVIQAFRQRALKRAKDDVDDQYEDEEDEGSGAPVSPDASPEDTMKEMFVSAPDAMWDLPPGAEIWESANVDVTPLVNSIQKELQWYASMRHLPLAALSPDSANQSAEGATTLKEEHLYAIDDRRDRASGGWARTMSMAFMFDGDEERADVSQIEPIWNPLERFSLTQKAEATSKAQGVLPTEAILRDIWQYDPAEVQQLMIMLGKDLLRQPLPASRS